MSVEFLKNLYLELLQKKSELEIEKNNLEIKLNENEKYIRLLKKEEEESFDAFSPRNQNQDLRKNIESFEKKKELLLQRENEIGFTLQEVNERIKEFDIIFRESKEEKDFLQKYAKQKKMIRKLQKRYRKDISFINSKLDFCYQIIDVDVKRCKSELFNLIKLLSERTEDNQEEHLVIYDTEE